MELFAPLGLIDYFLFHVGEIFNYNFFKNFFIPFFSLLHLGPLQFECAFDIVPEVPETILSSFQSFYFILHFRSYFYHFVFQLTDSFFSSDILLLIPSRVFLISVIVLFVSVCLFFNSSKSLLIDSYIFSILLSRFLIIFYIIILNSFSGSLPISSSFFRLVFFEFVPSFVQYFSAFSLFFFKLTVFEVSFSQA